MPFKSEEQRKAMYAAASGHSNIGIPESAARKFIKHSGDPLPEKDCKVTAYHDACRSGSRSRISSAYKDILGDR